MTATAVFRFYRAVLAPKYITEYCRVLSFNAIYATVICKYQQKAVPLHEIMLTFYCPLLITY